LGEDVFMTDRSFLPPFDAAQNERDRCVAVEDMIDSIAAMMRVARALLQTKRQVDLGGLEQDVGRLCAHALDLPLEQGRKMQPRLAALLDQLDKLSTALEAAKVKQA